jgi:hypothetical protein
MDPNARPTTRAYRAARRAQRSFLDNVENDHAPSASSTGEIGVADSMEEVDDDDLCPICQMLLHEPVTTTCRHTLCRFCMATWASTSLAAPMTVVDVDSEPVPFDAVSGLEARCPMCRTLTSALPDVQRDETLRSKYPQTWTQRHRETAADESTESSGSIEPTTCRRTSRESARMGFLRETFSYRHHQGSAHPPPSHFPPEPHYKNSSTLFYITPRLGSFHHHHSSGSQSWLQLGVRRCRGLAKRCGEGEFATGMDSGF